MKDQEKSIDTLSFFSTICPKCGGWLRFDDHVDTDYGPDTADFYICENPDCSGCAYKMRPDSTSVIEPLDWNEDHTDYYVPSEDIKALMYDLIPMSAFVTPPFLPKIYWFMLHWLQDCGGSVKDRVLEQEDRWHLEAMDRNYLVRREDMWWTLTDYGKSLLREIE